MKYSSNKAWLMAAAIACSLPLVASAVPITYTVSGANPNSGQTLSANAAFTTSLNAINVTLNNTLSNPNDVSQLISDLRFTISGTTTGATLASSSGTELNVATNGTYALGSTVATGWGLTTPTTSTIYLNVLGTAVGPEHLIIGPSNNGSFLGGTYSNANGSIAGNSAHNPFLASGASFTIALTGVTANTTITSAAFSFGTTSGLIESPGIPTGGPGVPDGGATVVLLGLGLLGLGLTRRLMHV